MRIGQVRRKMVDSWLSKGTYLALIIVDSLDIGRSGYETQ